MTLAIPTAPMRAALARLAALPAARAGAVLLEPESAGPCLILSRRTNAACASVPCPAMTREGEGRVIVSFDALNGLLARLAAEEIEFRWDTKFLRWKAGASGSFAAWPEDTLEPEIPEPAGTVLHFGADDLRDQLSVANSASFTESGRDFMRGVLIRRILGRVGVIGMDGRRFHASFGSPQVESIRPHLDDSGNATAADDGFLISREQIPAVLRQMGTGEEQVTMTAGRNVLQVACGDRLLRLVLSSVQPGDTERMAEERPYEITLPVDRAALLSAVKQALPLGRGENKAITIFLDSNHLRIDADDGQGNASSHEVPVAQPPSRTGVAFRASAPYVADLLEACPDALCELGFIKPGVLAWRTENRYCMVQLLRDGSLPKEWEP